MSAASHAPARASIALAAIVTCQLMLVLDATVVNIALSPIQHSLHFSPAGLSWVIDAYSLTFGGLLLLGGRAGDVFGRRRMLMLGLALFTTASLFGGLATTSTWLLVAPGRAGRRCRDGPSPSTLSLISATFEEGPDRNRALGIFTAVSAGGGSLGLVLGGALTSWVSWRWVPVHQCGRSASPSSPSPPASCRSRPVTAAGWMSPAVPSSPPDSVASSMPSSASPSAAAPA